MAVHSTQYTVLSTQYTVLSTQYSVLPTQYSVLSTQCSVLSTRYSVLSTQYSVLSTAYWVLIPQQSALARGDYAPAMPYRGFGRFTRSVRATDEPFSCESGHSRPSERGRLSSWSSQ